MVVGGLVLSEAVPTSAKVCSEAASDEWLGKDMVDSELQGQL